MTAGTAAVSFLVAASARGAVVLLVAMAAAALMRRQSAATRHVVLAGGIAAFLLLPAAIRLAPTWTIWTRVVDPVMPAVQAEGDGRAEALVPGPQAGPGRQLTHATPQAGALVSGDITARWESVGWSALLPLVWLAGAALVGLRLGAGAHRVRAMRRNAILIDRGFWREETDAIASQLSLGVRVAVVMGDEPAAPMTWGTTRPVIWLPVSARSWAADLRRAVLTHELAHIRRRDSLTQWMANAMVVLHWFNPVAWAAQMSLRGHCERACDDVVLALGAGPDSYARGLVEQARMLGAGHAAPTAGLAVIGRSRLEGRIVALLDRGVKRGPSSRAGTALTLALAALAVLILSGARVTSIVRPAVIALASPVEVRPVLAVEGGPRPRKSSTPEVAMSRSTLPALAWLVVLPVAIAVSPPVEPRLFANPPVALDTSGRSQPGLPAAAAARMQPPSPEGLALITECGGIASPSDRLMCYDMLTASNGYRVSTSTEMPAWPRGDKMPILIGGEMPQYPGDVRKAGVHGPVDLVFEIDHDGRVNVATRRVLSSPDVRLTLAVDKVLPTLRYTPAIASGEVVGVLVRQSFDFKPVKTETPRPAGP